MMRGSGVPLLVLMLYNIMYISVECQVLAPDLDSITMRVDACLDVNVRELVRILNNLDEKGMNELAVTVRRLDIDPLRLSRITWIRASAHSPLDTSGWAVSLKGRFDTSTLPDLIRSRLASFGLSLEKEGMLYRLDTGIWGYIDTETILLSTEKPGNARQNQLFFDFIKKSRDDGAVIAFYLDMSGEYGMKLLSALPPEATGLAKMESVKGRLFGEQFLLEARINENLSRGLEEFRSILKNEWIRKYSSSRMFFLVDALLSAESSTSENTLVLRVPLAPHIAKMLIAEFRSFTVSNFPLPNELSSTVAECLSERARVAEGVASFEKNWKNELPVLDVVELVRSGHLKRLPRCPLGGKFYLERSRKGFKIRCTTHR